MSAESVEHSQLTPLKLAFLKLEEMQNKIEAMERSTKEPIAVVGMGCRFPGGADSSEKFWQILRQGVDAVSEIPSDRWNVDEYYDPRPGLPGKMITRWGAFLREIDKFDPLFFGIAPREAVSMDPQQRLLLEVSWQALENAGQAPDKLSHCQVGVFIGVCKNDYMQLQLKQNDPTLYDVYFASGNAHSIMSGRLSYVLGLQGPSITIDTACSSSLVAVHLACQSLRSGECKMALAGGVNVILSPENTISFSKAGMLAKDGRCKTFDAAADGFVQGEGCGVIVLKRLSDALAEGNRILALIRGSAVNQDGPSSGLTAPNGPSQMAVIRQALKNAGLKSSQISYVETHGTATSLGDPIEVQALGEALGQDRLEAQPLMIGSVKTNIGHLEAAAGIAGLIKVVLALQHREIPPHLHLKKPNPFVRWNELPVVIPSELTPWRTHEGSLTAGVSSFGFSGTNAHIVVGEAPELQPWANANERPLHLFALSAKCENGLKTLCRLFSDHLMEHPKLSLGDVCFTANAGRAHFPHRLAAIVKTPADLCEKLRAFSEGERKADFWQNRIPSGDQPKIAFLFTGQGSQYIGMGCRLFETQPVFRAALHQCDQILSTHMGRSLLTLMYPEAGSDLTHKDLLEQTIYAQPALFAVEYALTQLWRSWGIFPSAVMGHSLGEYVAACVAGAFSLEEGLKLIAARGRLMQALPSGGRMVAVFADERRVAEAMGTHAGEVSIAAINGPENVVISGDGQAVAAILENLVSIGIGYKPLNVSHAFHSKLMEPMLDEFEKVVASVLFSEPHIRLISNVSGKPIGEGEITQHGYWRRHIRQPVRFQSSMEALYNQGYRVFVEMGPHPVLLGMGADCLAKGDEVWIASLRKGREDWHQMLASLGELYSQGVEVDWTGFDKDYRRQRLALPTYPFQRERFWIKVPQGPSSAESAARVPAKALTHPLLGHRLKTPLPDAVFATQLSTEALPFLSDHVVHGLVVFPATAYLEMVTAAAREYFGSQEVIIEDLTFKEALLLPAKENQLVELILSPDKEGAAGFRLFSLVNGTDVSQWKMHASGRVLSPADRLPKVKAAVDSVATIKARCMQRVDLNDFYEGLKARGLVLGPSFQGIEALWRCDGEAFAQVQLPSSAQGHADLYQVHPALLDACIQAVAAAVPGFDARDVRSEIYMPMGLDRFRYDEDRFAGQLFSHALIDVPDGGHRETMKVHVRLFDQDGKTITHFEGLHLKKIDPEVLLRVTGANINDWLYEVAWQSLEHGLSDKPAGSYLLGPAQIAERTAPLLPKIGAQLGVDIYKDLNRDLDTLCALYVVNGLRQLGFDFELNRIFSLDALSRELKVDSRHHRLLGRFLKILDEEGLLVELRGGWQVRGQPERTDPDKLCGELISKYRAQDVELKLLRRCGGEIAALLRAEADPLQLLFPGGNLDLTSKLYKTTPLAIAVNTMCKEAVLAAISRIPKRVKIRILEIGAGTGGTTAHILPILPDGQTEYTFTDIGQTFLKQAAEAFSDYSFLNYKLLDIEKDPLEQGFEPHQFDLIIAANVLHATADLSKTLTHVKQLLAPEALLLLAEATRPHRWYDLTFGFTDGWWKFVDLERRSSSPLLDQRQWEGLLSATGFGSTAIIPAAFSTEMLTDHAVVLARGRGMEGHMPFRSVEATLTPRQSPGLWIIFADRGDLGEQLAELLKKDGHRCHLVRPGMAYQITDEGRWTVNPAHPDDYHRLWSDSLGMTDFPCRGVIHLWTLDDLLSPFASVDQLLTAQDRGCRSVLSVLQAIAASGAVESPRLLLVTRGVHLVGDQKMLSVPAHAQIWGLAKVITLEHPDLRCLCVDLDPSIDRHESQLLCSEITAWDGEDQLAYRGGRRYAARLVRSKERFQKPERPPKTTSHPRRLELTTPGTPDGIELKPMFRQAPGAGEVEIRVHATGLNFRDVLNVLGMRKDQEQLGGECAGTIAAVGEGVNGFEIGDEVIAITQGAFSAFVNVKSELVIPKPKQMSFEEAAAFPLAYLTAYYALYHVGKLRQGERVLIHAAAGGVGMAAVQLAISTGAEIFATAGSPPKRSFLRSLGIQHVMDSRTLDFADEVMAQTQGEGLDIVLNALTGEFIPKSLALLRAKGRFLEIGKSQIMTPQQAAGVNSKATYLVVDLAEKIFGQPRTVRSMLLELVARFEQGTLKSIPTKSFSMEQAKDAFRYMAQAKHIGKVLISQPDSNESPTTVAIMGNAGPLHLGSDRTYLITGGLAGLGLRVAQWMVTRGARSLVLMGRSEPSPEAVVAISNMKQIGAAIEVIRGDVSSEQDVSRALARIAALELPLQGIVHSAGVLDDGVLLQQNWERFQNVMAPKVRGAWLLHRMTLDIPLDFFVLFSSISSIFGSAGQANHAAANAFLDALAHYRHANGLPGISINWGAWSDIGAAVKHNVGSRIIGQGIGTIAPEEGLRVLTYSIQSGTSQLIVSPINWQKFLNQISSDKIPPFYLTMQGDAREQLGRKKASPTTAPAYTGKGPGLLDRLAAAPPAKRRTLFIADVQEKTARALGISPSAEIDRRQPLSEMGLDSLMAVELRNALGASLSLSLPATLLFDYPSIEKVTDYLCTKIPCLQSTEDVGQSTVGESHMSISNTLDTIERLSEEEIDQLFGKRMEKQTSE